VHFSLHCADASYLLSLESDFQKCIGYLKVNPLAYHSWILILQNYVTPVHQRIQLCQSQYGMPCVVTSHGLSSSLLLEEYKTYDV